jgi:hypothetical protein
MMRAFALSAGCGALALLSLVTPTAGADPDQPPADVTYLIGKCWDPSDPVVERPTEVTYNCDSTSVMENMRWLSWGPGGAVGTGMDNSVECQPNCAEGPHLFNPIIVHAWNPMAPTKPGCPAGLQFYTELTVAYPLGAPPWIKPGTTWSPDTEFIDADGMPAVHFSVANPYSCTPLAG